LIFAKVSIFTHSTPVVDTGTKITGKPLDEICHNAKIAVIVLMPTFSTFSTYNCLDAEFLLQFPCKAFFRSFAVLNFTSWKLPEPREVFARRSTGKQDGTVRSNDRGSDDFFAAHAGAVTEVNSESELRRFKRQAIA
jgi:hypothetical protein